MPGFLHAAHQARETLGQLELVSWLAIGLGVGVLVLTWGKVIAWLRDPGSPGPSLRRWGADSAGWYFEIANPGPGEWSVVDSAGTAHELAADPGDRFFRALAGTPPPVALRSSDGFDLTL